MWPLFRIHAVLSCALWVLLPKMADRARSVDARLFTDRFYGAMLDFLRVHVSARTLSKATNESDWSADQLEAFSKLCGRGRRDFFDCSHRKVRIQRDDRKLEANTTGQAPTGTEITYLLLAEPDGSDMGGIGFSFLINEALGPSSY